MNKYTRKNMKIHSQFMVLVLMTVLIPVSAFSGNPPGKISVENYIGQYYKIAVNEMHRSGIPASITLAQGIIESGSGNSRLATEGNNHFGIKCHKGWTGKTIREDDDEKNECFRKYKSAEDSYLDHTDFLQTRDRYAFLFKLKRNDYKAWAKGLKKAGYATNPKYAPILINVIEKYSLYEYDKMDIGEENEELIVKNDNPKTIDDQIEKDETQPIEPTGIFITNRIKTVILQEKSSLEQISEEYEISVSRLKKYNELLGGRELKGGMKVYLQPKRNKAEVKYHKVKKWEKMYDISQLYGMKISQLYKKNLMLMGQEPAIGQRIYLRVSRNGQPKLRDITKDDPDPVLLEKEETIEKKETPIEQKSTVKKSTEQTSGTQSPEMKKIIALDEIAIPNSESDSLEPDEKVKYEFDPENSIDNDSMTTDIETQLDESEPGMNLDKNPSLAKEYTVVKGDTLYGLSRKFDVTVSQLKEWNDLTSSEIKIGQGLIVGIGK